MTTVFPKILLLDDDFRDTARVLYSHIIKKTEELDRWDLNNLVHLLQLIWPDPCQVVNFQNAIISRDPYSACTVVALPKDQNGIGNFRISPIKVACCLFRWPKLTEIRRIASAPWCKFKLNYGGNNICLNPYHYQAKLAHYEFQYVSNTRHDVQKNDKFQILLTKDGIEKVKHLKNKILKNIQENSILLSALNAMPQHLVEAVEIEPTLALNSIAPILQNFDMGVKQGVKSFPINSKTSVESNLHHGGIIFIDKPKQITQQNDHQSFQRIGDFKQPVQNINYVPISNFTDNQDKYAIPKQDQNNLSFSYSNSISSELQSFNKPIFYDSLSQSQTILPFENNIYQMKT